MPQPLRVLVTGSAGHLGEALMRTFQDLPGYQAVGLDRLASPWTRHVGSIADRAFVARCVEQEGIEAVLHTATLHKPHVVTHSRQDFVDTNITGTLNLLEEAVARRMRAFVFTSTTSTFGRALVPAAGEPAAWITEEVRPLPKNIYGVTKVAAEDLCELVHRRDKLPCLVLRTSRFFPEADDQAAVRERYDEANSKVNELPHRRVDIADVVDAHLRALERAPSLGFERFIVSATTPFTREDLPQLRVDAAAVLARRVPGTAELYARCGWNPLPVIDRVYVNDKARELLGWTPRHDFAAAIASLSRGDDYRSPLARAIGRKPYHEQTFEHGPFPVE